MTDQCHLNRSIQIGLIVLQSDETIERDMRTLLPADVEFLVSRVPSGASVTSESLQAMEAVLTQSASMFPAGACLSGVAYGCTSGTAQIGVGRIAALIRAGVTTPEVTQPVSALIAACQELNVSRIGLVSPYIASVSDVLRNVLAVSGIRITQFTSFNEPVEEKVVRIGPQMIKDAAIEIGSNPDCEAVFLSCTNLRTLDVIDDIEAHIKKPVLSSNQVLAWHLAQSAGFGAGDCTAGMLLKSLPASPIGKGRLQ